MQRLQPDAVVCVGHLSGLCWISSATCATETSTAPSRRSRLSAAATLKLLFAAEQELNKDYTSRLVSSQVVPSFNDDLVPAVREYREAMDRYHDAIMPPDSLDSIRTERRRCGRWGRCSPMTS